jgi:uncharacterized Fe-S cluster-containing MiaB family protein
MSDEEPPVPEEVLTSAKDQLDEEEISLADNEEILHALSELTPVYENDRSYFVLGNYDREDSAEIPETLVRVSVGLEDAEDLCEDLRTALP